MSNAVFPALPGLSWDVKKSPTWATRVQRAKSGMELRAGYYSVPIWKWTLSYDCLRAGAVNGQTLTELQTLLDFYNARSGMYDSFLYDDPTDDVVPDTARQQFATGDGSTTAFQLTRMLAGGSFAEPIYNLNAGLAATKIYVAGVLQTVNVQYALSAGLVTFLLPPPNAAPGLTPSSTGGTLAAATYYYKISALNASGESIGSAEASCTTTGTTGSVALTWAAVTGATNYRVYRGTSAGGENVYYTPGNVTSYTDTGAASTAGSPLAVATGKQAPATGAALTWSGGYYWRVRFDQDAAEFAMQLQNIWDLKTLSFVSVKGS